jgi:micrococcal nuclease
MSENTTRVRGIGVRSSIDGALYVKTGLSLLILVSLLLFSSCNSVPTAARVTRVIDGDTIVVQGGYHIRYIGIDTPEIGEPFYQEAKDYNRELVGGKKVRLEKDVTDKDKYDRLLRYVYAGDVFVNAELVREGYAYVYPESLFPDIKYYDLLKEAETEAREAEKGIWGG